MPPAEIAALLRKVNEAVAAIVLDHGGMVYRQDGDESLALFNAPLCALDDELGTLFTYPKEEFPQQLLRLLHRLTNLTSAGIYGVEGDVLKQTSALHPTPPLEPSLSLRRTPLAERALSSGVLASVPDATELTEAQPFLAAFKGGGGEVQRNPEKPTRIVTLSDGAPGEEDWPALTANDRYPWRDEPLDPALLRRECWVADIVYFPLETELLAAARKAGCRTLGGDGMAVHQAARAFELFTGVSPDVERMTAAFAAYGGMPAE